MKPDPPVIKIRRSANASFSRSATVSVSCAVVLEIKGLATCSRGLASPGLATPATPRPDSRCRAAAYLISHVTTMTVRYDTSDMGRSATAVDSPALTIGPSGGRPSHQSRVRISLWVRGENVHALTSGMVIATRPSWSTLRSRWK